MKKRIHALHKTKAGLTACAPVNIPSSALTADVGLSIEDSAADAA